MRGNVLIWLLCVLSFAHVAPPDQPPVLLVDAPGGITILIWTNDVEADSVVVANISRTAETCAYPVVVAVDAGLTGQATQVPEGPPYEERCLLRPGDRLYLQRYRNKFAIDQLGPFVVPVRVWLPRIER